MPKVYREDRYTGDWSAPGRHRAQGPLVIAFDDGVADVDDDTLADLAPWMPANQFSTDDNRQAKPKAPAKRKASASKKGK